MTLMMSVLQQSLVLEIVLVIEVVMTLILILKIKRRISSQRNNQLINVILKDQLNLVKDQLKNVVKEIRILRKIPRRKIILAERDPSLLTNLVLILTMTTGENVLPITAIPTLTLVEMFQMTLMMSVLQQSLVLVIVLVIEVVMTLILIIKRNVGTKTLRRKVIKKSH